MDSECILVRTGEIFLKSGNKHVFENQLVHNIVSYLKQIKVYAKLDRACNRFILRAEKKELDKIELKHIFGVVSYNRCIETEMTEEAIKKEILKLLKQSSMNLKNKTFRVTVNRADKRFKINSMDFAINIANFIISETEKAHNFKPKVSLKDYDINFGIELLDEKALIFTETTECFGGLPLGIEGTVIAIIEEGKQAHDASILAALSMMRRGCKIIPVAYKNLEINLLKKYSYGSYEELKIIKNNEDLKKIADENNAKAIVVGNNLKNIDKIDKTLNEFTIITPLIIFDNDEIKKELEKYNI